LKICLCIAFKLSATVSPELTRSAAINLNTRLRLPPTVVILSFGPVARRPQDNASYARSGVATLPRGSGGPAQGSKQYGAPTQTDNYRLDRQLLDIFARDCFEFYLWGKQTSQADTRQGPIRSSRVIVLFAHLPAVANLFPLPRFALRSKSGENIVIGRQYFVRQAASAC
jgi:hypothetical protein